MSMLPYVLGELRGLSAALDGRRRRSWERDDFDLLDDLLACRAQPRTVLDLDDTEQYPVHHLVFRPRHLLRRQLSAPYRRAQELRERKKDGGLLINVDVKQFLPEELSVKVLKEEGYVVLEGKHEERPDEHGYVQRQFTRRYKLPSHVDPDTVTSKLTSDGVLQVTAPRREALPAPKENVRHVTITHTDRPAVKDAAEEAAETNATNDKVEREIVGTVKTGSQSQSVSKSEVIGA